MERKISINGENLNKFLYRVNAYLEYFAELNRRGKGVFEEVEVYGGTEKLL